MKTLIAIIILLTSLAGCTRTVEVAAPTPEPTPAATAEADADCYALIAELATNPYGWERCLWADTPNPALTERQAGQLLREVWPSISFTGKAPDRPTIALATERRHCWDLMAQGCYLPAHHHIALVEPTLWVVLHEAAHAMIGGWGHSHSESFVCVAHQLYAVRGGTERVIERCD